MVVMERKKDFDLSELETGDLCLGYEKINLLFNAGPFPAGGDCLVIEANGELMTVNSNDLIHDIEAYNLSTK